MVNGLVESAGGVGGGESGRVMVGCWIVLRWGVSKRNGLG
jgi:hypothetical protein